MESTDGAEECEKTTDYVDDFIKVTIPNYIRSCYAEKPPKV